MDAAFGNVESPGTGPLGFVAYPLADYAKADLGDTTYLSFTDRTTLVVDAHARVSVCGAEQRPLRSVDLETDVIAWGQGAFGPAFTGHHARLVLRTEDDAYSVAESLARSEEEARERLAPLERALTGRLADAAKGDVSAPEPNSSALAAPRFSFAREGDLIVLRDYRSAGPRERAARYLSFSLVLLAGGFAAGALTWRTYAASGASTTVLGYTVLTAVLLVGAFAMGRIFAHARAYAASQTPVAWFGDDRVVVLPWVSRAGAVDRRPEGRLGAAIVTSEIDSVVVLEHDGVFAATLTGPHGPIEIIRTDARSEADRVAEVARVLLAEVASPKKTRRSTRR